MSLYRNYIWYNYKLNAIFMSLFYQIDKIIGCFIHKIAYFYDIMCV